jgi:hypothetical protein
MWAASFSSAASLRAAAARLFALLSAAAEFSSALLSRHE